MTDATPVTSLRTIRCDGTVEERVARVESALRGAGMTIFARIDQAREARTVGLSMRPAVLLVFGSPKVGAPLMIARPTAAIDLPLKVLIWEDEGATTWLTYNTPALLEQRHGLPGPLASLLAPASQLLERAAAAGTA